MKHANTKAVFRYWQTLRGASPAPQQRMVHPGDLKEALPYIFVLQRFDADHYVFRLAGTGYCALFGREFRSQNILSLFQGASRKYLSVLLDRVIGVPCAGLGETRALTLGGDNASFEYLLLPLADADGRINRILGSANVADWGSAAHYDRFASQTLMSLQAIDTDSQISSDGATAQRPGFWARKRLERQPAEQPVA